MIPTLNIILIQNAFFAWLFESAPAIALGCMFAWAIWRYEAKLWKIESDLERVKDDQKVMKDAVSDLQNRMTRVEVRLEGLESKMELAITLLSSLVKEKRSAA